MTETHSTEVKVTRADLMAPIEAVVQSCQLLKEGVVTATLDPEFVEDLQEVIRGADEIWHFVHSTARDAAADPRDWRHDVANRLNHIHGRAQFMVEAIRDDEEEDDSAPPPPPAGGLLSGKALGHQVREILRYVRTCISLLDRMRQTGAGEVQKPAAGQPPKNKAIRSSRLFRESVFTPTVQARILVVDDKAENREILERFLERDGHRVETAVDGAEALRLIDEHDYDLVLLDLMMPGIDGFEVLDELRHKERLHNLPVIVVSGLDDAEDVLVCLETGAEDFLSRPLDMRMLRAKVASSLERHRLRQRTLEQFFTPELARRMMRDPSALSVGRELDVTVLFCDIRRFSTVSERLSPSDTVSWLSDVMDALSECVIRHSGVLVDFVGDELLAMWGAPQVRDDHADLACRAALDMMQSMPKINQRWRSRLDPTGDNPDLTTAIGIGINSGLAYVGNSGTSRKFKYGPLGNMVNLASRVQGATKYLKTNVLFTGATQARLSDPFLTRRLCQVRVKNIMTPVALIELLDTNHCDRERQQQYEAALELFEARKPWEAFRLVSRLVSDDPTDGPSRVLMNRVVDVMDEHDYEVVWELPGK